MAKRASGDHVTAVEKKLAAMVSGLKTLDPARTLDWNGRSTTVSDILDEGTEHLDKFEAVKAAMIALRAALFERRRDQNPTREYLADGKLAIVNAVGKRSVDLRKFGLKMQMPRKKLTIKQKLAKAEKAKATREARAGKKKG
jgi:hypothetical protein